MQREDDDDAAPEGPMGSEEGCQEEEEEQEEGDDQVQVGSEGSQGGLCLLNPLVLGDLPLGGQVLL